MDYIFFFYGLSFLLLASVSFFLSRTANGGPAWPWLSLFALAHGANEWLDLAAFSFFDNNIFSALRLAIMAASFFFLLEFARRSEKEPGTASALVRGYALLLPLAALGAFYGLNGLNASARYALGLPAGLLAARVLYRYAAGKTRALRAPLLLAAACFALYALAAGAIVPGSQLFPARWLNYSSFTSLFGFPVQLLRGLLATAISAGIWVYYLNSADRGATAAPGPSRKARIGWTLLTALLFALGAGWLLTDALGKRAHKETVEDSLTLETILSNRLSDSMQIAEQSAAAMSGSPAIPGILTRPGRSGAASAEAVLDRYCASFRLSVCYLINPEGVTVASSNRATPQSFVGKSYAFRPYFTEAAAGRPATYFALGVTTRERGYYASSPVRGPGGRLLGVAVVKKNMDFLAEDLRRFAYSFVVSPEGVIFLSSRPDLLFRSLWPATGAARASLESSKQFGKIDFEPLMSSEASSGTLLNYSGGKFYVSRKDINAAGWSLVSLTSLYPVNMARLAGILLSLTLCVLLLAAFLALVESETARETAENLLRLKEEVKTLSGIVPICASCKKIRDDKGYWDKVESYVAAHTHAKFSHGLCPACVRKLYPEYADGEEREEKT